MRTFKDDPRQVSEFDDSHEVHRADFHLNREQAPHPAAVAFAVAAVVILVVTKAASAAMLVPVAPDMNSVISLQAAERYFEGTINAEGRPILPYYVLNQFDASLPLHLDVREVLRRQLGDRLLPFVVRRAPAVGEALAEGMTVIDYEPEAAVAEDYRNIAGWLRNLSPPATQGFRHTRWSER